MQLMQQQRVGVASVSGRRPSLAAAPRPAQQQQLQQRNARLLLARAEPDNQVKAGRAFNEATGEVTGPGEGAQGGQQPLYADQVAPQMKKPQDNMSKEMKQRLRQEYYGLGGAENKVSRPSRGVGAVVAVVMLEEEQQVAADAERVGSAAAASSSGSSGGSSKWVIDEKEVLHSTNEHRAWTYSALALQGAGLAAALANVHGAGDAAAVGGAVLAAYLLSDLGTGVAHWGLDNYGDGATPVFGRQIAAFQGHHQRPWTITQREFANNVHQVFKPALPWCAAALLLGPLLPLGLRAFAPTFLFFVCMSQQFHAWSHMKPSELPRAVVALQDAGVLIGRKAHGAHHKPNFEGNYSIVSGWWNPILDNSGFFRKLEKAIADATGVEPRSWYPPEAAWEEEVRGAPAAAPEAARR